MRSPFEFLSMPSPFLQLGGSLLAAYAAGGYTPNLVLDGPGGVYADPAGNSAIHTISESARDNPAAMFSDGVLKWSAHNFLTYSQQFDPATTDWATAGGGSLTVTDNAAEGPDGTTTAARYQSSGVLTLRQDILNSAGRTFAIWVKSAGTGKDTFRLLGNSNRVSGDLTATNTWQLITYSPALGSSTSWGITRDSSDNDVDIYIWGAHHYNSDLGGMVANPEAEAWQTGDAVYYVPTTTAARYLTRWGAEVYVGGEWVQSVGLFEPQATNLITFSNNFAGADWTASNLALTANAADSPLGSSQATLFEKNSGGIPSNDINCSFTTGTNYCSWAIIKRESGAVNFEIAPQGGTVFQSSTNVVFDPDDGSIVSAGSNADSYGSFSLGDGWYVVWYTEQSIATGSADVQFRLSGGSIGDGIYVAHAQCEAADLPSSPVITNGSTVTRTADTNGLIIPYESLDLGGVMPDAVSIQVEGYMTYADIDEVFTLRPYLWGSGADLFEVYVSTSATRTGQALARQLDGGTNDFVATGQTYYSPGVDVPFNIAVAHTTSRINAAFEGTALAENDTPTGLPDLSTSDLYFAPTGSFYITKVRIWLGDDIGDAGLEEATA